MIYDAGFMGVFLPVGLYYTGGGGGLRKWVGYGYVDIDSSYTGFIASAIDADYAGRINFGILTAHNAASGFSSSLYYETLPTDQAGSDLTVVSTLIKSYGVQAENSYAHFFQNGILTTVSISGYEKKLIPSRDNKVYYRDSSLNTLHVYAGGSSWTLVKESVSDIIKRIQLYNANYYYIDSSPTLKWVSTGGLSGNKSMPNNIKDFWLSDTERVVVTNSAVHFLDASLNIEKTHNLDGAITYDSSHRIAKQGQYMSIRCDDRILLFRGRDLFLEVPVAASSVALLSY